MPAIPEPHFFDRPLPDSGLSDLGARQMDTAQDDARYRLLFGAAPTDALVGEITPRYAICTDLQIAHMHAIAPQAKLIFLLRHPVDRFWSQCLMKQAGGSLSPGDPAAMQLFDSANGRPRGEYTKTLVRYCRYFDPSQILLVFTDAIRQMPVAVLEAIHHFLGLPPIPIDPVLVAQPVNAALTPTAMPTSLRERISAAYRSEIETIAELFSAPATSWLADSEPLLPYPAARLLTAAHVDWLRQRLHQPLGLKSRRADLLFCVSMQRSGTTSVGDWLESHGLVRAGHPTSARLQWSFLWFRGEYDRIFCSPEFQSAEIFEDDPWWSGNAYKILAERFPQARFILLTRDADSWFESLCHHSGGRNPGPTLLHANVYQRQDDLQALIERNPQCDPLQHGLLSILEHREHYKAIYRRHTAAILQFFAAMPQRLFTGPLNSPQTFIDLCAFAGVSHNPAIPIPHANARSAAMVDQLARIRGSSPHQ